MSQKLQANFLTGIILGAVLTLIVGLFLKMPSSSSGANSILAQLDGAKLTRSELQKNLGGKLVPIENDEYSVLISGTQAWLERQLLEKEATARNLSLNELFSKEIWAKVKVTPDQISNYYQNNKNLFGTQPLDKVSNIISQTLRNQNFETTKNTYIKSLMDKYHAKILLARPSTYIPGWQNIPRDSQNAMPQPNQNMPAPTAPAPIVNFSDLEGKASQGPANAAITLVEFSDFHCPFCSKATPTIEQLMAAYPGKIRRVWRHYPLPFHQGADRTHMASECAHEQGKFWEFHNKAFEMQKDLQKPETVDEIAKQIGLDKKKFDACLSSNKYKDFIQKEIAKGNESGVRGTPSFFLNGRILVGALPLDQFKNMVEGILDPSKAVPFPAAPNMQPQQPRPPVVNANFDDLKGKPSVGPENAPITLVQFSDFHCPFCQRVEPAIDQLMKNFQGKIRKVWRHYPLPFHQGSARTHEASECAHEQNKFWEFHDAVFKNFGNTKDDAALKQVASQAGLDMKKFESCLSSGKYTKFIQDEIAKGSSIGVDGTPATFVNGQLVSGAMPYENFEAIVKEKLAQKK